MRRNSDCYEVNRVLSPPRATDNFIGECPYTSGGRNAGVSGKRGLLHLRSYDALYAAVHSSAYGHSKATLQAQCALFFHIRTPSGVQALCLFMSAVHSSAYGHSKATLRARCALFFHIRTSSSVQALCLYANMKKQPHGFRKVVFSLVPCGIICTNLC